MKSTGLLFFLMAVIFAGCNKSSESCGYTNSSVVASVAEVQNLQSYLDANSIAATKHASGFFYEIISAGTGASVSNLCSGVTVKYKGYLTSGSCFDSTKTSLPTFALGDLIVGWQKGIPLIKSGGTIKLYIPPSLGYGSNTVGPIPANSNLIFEIKLVDVL